MATSYTTFLGLALPVTGELSGTWGDTVNNYISTYLDSAIAGSVTVTTDTTLTKTTGSSLGSTSSQYAIIIASPASANITITAPATSKLYVLINTSATYTVKIVGAGPTTGVTLAVSDKALVAWNGSDFVRVGASAGGSNTQVQYNSSGNLAGSANLTFNGTTLTANTLNLTNALGVAYGGTGSTSTTFVNLASNVTGTLPIANGGTGSTSTTFVNLASNVTGTLPIANGGTGSTSTTFVSLTTNVTGTLPVGNGGSGAATFTANNVLLGNGTSAFQVVAPSTAGNVLTSNGTTWQSTAPAASGVSQAKATMISLIFGAI
jgi:hypothetical protein